MLSPLMMRLRYGKVMRSAFRPIGYSLITAPFFAILSASPAFSGG